MIERLHLVVVLLLLITVPAGAASKAGLRAVVLEDPEPVASRAGPLWRAVPADGLEVAGRAVRFREAKRKVEVIEDGEVVERIARLPAVVELSREIDGRKADYGLAVRRTADGGFEVASRYALELKSRAGRAFVLDLDLDGVLPEPGEDGLLHAVTGTVAPFTGEVWFRTAGYDIRDGVKPVAVPEGDVGAGLTLLNHYRQVTGLRPVREDPELSRGARAHARYLIANWSTTMNRHKEEPGKPFYTEEGARAARGLQGSTPVDAIVDNLDIVFHRRYLLRPALEHIGIGTATEADVGAEAPSGPSRMTVLDTGEWNGQGELPDRPVLWPAAGQTDAPLVFTGREVPVPLPAGVGKTGHGYPVTAIFYGKEAWVTAKEMTLHRIVGKGAEVAVEGWWFGPGKEIPSTGGTYDYAYRRNSDICHYLPKDPLETKGRYRASVTWEVEGGAHTESWTFTTGRNVSSPVR